MVILLLFIIGVGFLFVWLTRQQPPFVQPAPAFAAQQPRGLVNRAWGSKQGFERAPFQAGDHVIVQACYPYGAKNIKPVIDGNGIPVAYLSVGTLERNDNDRVGFYKSLGIFDALAGAVTRQSIMGEPYYDPSKLASTVLPAYRKIIDAVASFGARHIELDNMDFWKVNQERKNATQDLINAYILALVDYTHSKGLMVWQKNTASLASRLSAHPACAGLITENVGDSDPGMCKQFQTSFGTHYGSGKKPWFDFAHGGGTRCRTTTAAVLAQKNGVWLQV